jgi:hypothetical protein
MFHRSVMALITLCLVFSGAGSASGTTLPDIISITETTVYRWNFDTSTNDYVKPTGTSLFGDMTRTNDGRFLAYRTNYNGNTPALYEINPTTGTSSIVVTSSTGAYHVIALATMSDDNLFGYDTDLGFVRIDSSTLAYQTVPITASNSDIKISTGGMATSSSGEIYAWCSGFASGSGIFSELFKIDPDAGTAQEIGGYTGLSVSTSFNAMAFSPDGRLFGFTEINAKSPLTTNSIYELNLVTGMPTFLAQRSILADVRGAAFVPEPSTFLLLGIGAISLLAYAWRWRKHRT